jgi:hypothetical protein
MKNSRDHCKKQIGLWPNIHFQLELYTSQKENQLLPQQTLFYGNHTGPSTLLPSHFFFRDSRIEGQSASNLVGVNKSAALRVGHTLVGAGKRLMKAAPSQMVWELRK